MVINDCTAEPPQLLRLREPKCHNLRCKETISEVEGDRTTMKIRCTTPNTKAIAFARRLRKRRSVEELQMKKRKEKPPRNHRRPPIKTTLRAYTDLNRAPYHPACILDSRSATVLMRTT
ncbi:hypothetical protein Bca4012_066199 [Brassica carinata]|uniref:Uncharacterized protein n=1 Tax=Brassica carinata TaxID=52824 RepID=A0A8X8AYL5_BRACI|nr:hypothetical protein Bca52824_018504 [Brassica carinata]